MGRVSVVDALVAQVRECDKGCPVCGVGVVAAILFTAGCSVASVKCTCGNRHLVRFRGKRGLADNILGIVFV